MYSNKAQEKVYSSYAIKSLIRVRIGQLLKKKKKCNQKWAQSNEKKTRNEGSSGGAVYVPTTVNYAVPKNTGAYFKKHTCSLRYGEVAHFPLRRE